MCNDNSEQNYSERSLLTCDETFLIVVISRIIMPPLIGHKGSMLWWGWKWYEKMKMRFTKHRREILEHQNTKWGDVFWKSGVPSLLWSPRDFELWSCSSDTGWLSSLLTWLSLNIFCVTRLSLLYIKIKCSFYSLHFTQTWTCELSSFNISCARSK